MIRIRRRSKAIKIKTRIRATSISLNISRYPNDAQLELLLLFRPLMDLIKIACVIDMIIIPKNCPVENCIPQKTATSKNVLPAGQKARQPHRQVLFPPVDFDRLIQKRFCFVIYRRAMVFIRDIKISFGIKLHVKAMSGFCFKISHKRRCALLFYFRSA